VAMTSRNSVERLAEEALTKFFTTEAPMFTDKIVDEVNQLRYSDKGKQRGKGMVLESDSKELAAMVSIFNRDLSETDDQARRTEIPAKPDAIRGLVAILEANKEWFGKMIVSITPMLTKLTTDDLRGLLSPDYDDINDQRPIVDSMRIVEGGYGLYFGTDALADNTVAKALAAMALADASAVAAEIYNYSQDNLGTQQRRVHIFLDEWRDSMCEAAIQIAGKGRGAGLHLWALGQTLPDLVDALGSETAALTFMGNMNNLIVGATNDQSTIELITRKLGETVVVDKTTAQSVGSKTEDTGLEYSVNTATKISAKDMALFPEPLLPGMPDLQFIGVFNRAQIIKGRIPVLKI
jgi:conjugal transfer pilus assembly protein TraD